MDTRSQILEKNFHSIHINGFQGTRTDIVIKELGITKGAFYHYFPDKLSMGYAVLDEIIYPMYVGQWESLEGYEGHPINGIIASLERIKGVCNDENVIYGCPLNNLIQEMSSVDEGFNQRFNRIFDKQIKLIKAAIAKGQKMKQIDKKIEAQHLAYFIIAAIDGSYAIGKTKKSREVFIASMNQLIHYLDSLKK